MNNKVCILKNMLFSNSPFGHINDKLFTLQIVIIYSRLHTDCNSTAFTLALLLVLAIDFEKEIGLEFPRP